MYEARQHLDYTFEEHPGRLDRFEIAELASLACVKRRCALGA